MIFARSHEPGANTIVHLASSPQLADVSGGYFYDSRQIEPSPAARDDATARCLWQESEKTAGLFRSGAHSLLGHRQPSQPPGFPSSRLEGWLSNGGLRGD
jgi:hypothetical protein